MNHDERNKKYNDYVNAKKPATKNFPTLIYAYLVGGFICILGQFVLDILMYYFPTMSISSQKHDEYNCHPCCIRYDMC